MRALTAHQHVLSGRSATLHGRLKLLAKQQASWAQAQVPQGLHEAPGACTSPSGPGNGVAETADLGSPAASPSSQTALRPASHRALAAAALLDAAQTFHLYGIVEPACRCLEAAGTALGLAVEVSGALGTRTVHQVEAKAQLVLQVGRCDCCCCTG